MKKKKSTPCILHDPGHWLLLHVKPAGWGLCCNHPWLPASGRSFESWNVENGLEYLKFEQICLQVQQKRKRPNMWDMNEKKISDRKSKRDVQQTKDKQFTRKLKQKDTIRSNTREKLKESTRGQQTTIPSIVDSLLYLFLQKHHPEA